MKNERLTYFYYDHHNSMAESCERYKVSLQDDGRVLLVVNEDFRTEKEYYLDDTSIFDELLDVVKSYKMDKYKREYKPLFEVYDGDSWSLYYKYDSGRSVSSGGYMAWPSNYHDARNAISECFKKRIE